VLHLEVVEPDVIDAESGGKALRRNNSDYKVNDAEGGNTMLLKPALRDVAARQNDGGATRERKTSVR
jgi:hypothetical protein